MKFLYYCACIGDPNIKIKFQILKSNLLFLYNQLQEPFDIVINLYSLQYQSIFEKLQKLSFIRRVYFYGKKGVLTELFLTNPHNKYITDYDFILFILDDVKLIHMNLQSMILEKKKYKLDLLSPKIMKATHSYMYLESGLNLHNFLEIYCLLLSPSDLTRFFSLYSTQNKWMWGVDLLFGYFQIRAAVMNSCICEHVLPSKGDFRVAQRLMADYYRSLHIKNHSIQRKYHPIQEKIHP